ncbi:MAG TPA: hypothetical protein VFG27_07110 [Pseudomonadales bacterium]|nr:hypothetical protein [Pseudomonadales bacterium]
MSPHPISRAGLAAVLVATLLLAGLARPAAAPAAEGEMRWALHDQVVNVPIYELAFIWGVGPRVEESGASLIPGYAYSAPMEDLRLKK